MVRDLHLQVALYLLVNVRLLTYVQDIHRKEEACSKAVLKNSEKD
jgi:hypothetical protein